MNQSDGPLLKEAELEILHIEQTIIRRIYGGTCNGQIRTGYVAWMGESWLALGVKEVQDLDGVSQDPRAILRIQNYAVL